VKVEKKRKVMEMMKMLMKADVSRRRCKDWKEDGSQTDETNRNTEVAQLNSVWFLANLPPGSLHSILPDSNW
jgi:hypothetical protein